VWNKYTTSCARRAPRRASKKRLSEINQRLASLYTEFSQNVLADESDHALPRGGSDSRGCRNRCARRRPRRPRSAASKGQWAILNTRSSMEPSSPIRAPRPAREGLAHVLQPRRQRRRAGQQGHHREIVRLRAERAKLLGYPTHAHWRLEKSMAKTPERAMELMEAFWRARGQRAAEEVADMQARRRRGMQIEPWDYRYYAEKVRKERFDVDDNEVMPYLQLENLREAMFWVAGELLDLHFTPAATSRSYIRRARLGSDERAGSTWPLLLRSVRAPGQAARARGWTPTAARSASTARSRPSSRTTATT
jgi:peptidyl-dipeptidase Dcp